MIRNKIKILGFILIGLAIALFVPTISINSDSQATRLKRESMGGHFLSETEPDYKKKLYITTGAFALSGFACLGISNIGNSTKRKNK